VDALAVWKPQALNDSQEAREKELACPLVSMGAKVCCASTSLIKDQKSEPNAAAGKET